MATTTVSKSSPKGQQNAGITGMASRMASVVLRSPITLIRAILSRGIRVLRPYAPQIIPAVVFVFFIPLIVVLSILAGVMVWRSLTVGWEAPLYLQYGDGVPPYAYANLPAFVPQQRYDISVHLKIPATESNLALGNFMTSLTLSTSSNKTLISTRRSAIAVSPRPSIFSRRSNVITVDIPLVSSFISSTSTVLAYAEIGRRDSWKSIGDGQGRELSVVSASLRGIAIPHGIRGLAIRFPFTFSVISSMTFLMILSSMLGMCIVPIMLPYPSPESDTGPLDEKVKVEPSSAPPPLESTDDDDGDLTKFSKRRKSSKRRLKTEVGRISILPADTPGRLRRRASKRLDGGSDSDS